MQNNKLAPTLLLATSLFLPQLALASNDNFLNGKPFSYLNEQNLANSDAIAALAADTQLLFEGLNKINADIDNLETTIQGNKTSIDSLKTDLSTLEADVAASQQDINDLKTALQQLTDQHNADLVTLNQAIQSINTDIDDLQLQINTLSISLNSELALLKQAVTSNSSDISILLINVTTIMGQITIINTTLISTEDRLSTLETAVDDINTDLAELQATVNSLVPRVSALEQLHITELVYSQPFTEGVAQTDSSPQTLAWTDFRNDATGTFSSIEIRNSLGGSVSCTDTTITTQIANALNTQTLADTLRSFSCQGQLWNIGRCGNEIELNAGSNTGVCFCDQDASVRPNLAPNNPNWGGVGTDFGGTGGTCFTPTQTLEVILTH